MRKKVYMLVANSVYSDPRVRRESKALAEQGYQVTVGGIGLKDHRPQEAGIPGVNVSLVPPSAAYRASQRFAVRFRPSATAGGKARSVFSANGDQRSTTTQSSSIRSVHAALQFLGISASLLGHRRSIEIARPDLIHAHDLNALLPALRMARRTGADVVYDAHEVMSEMGSFAPWYRQGLRWLESRLVRKVKIVITVSAGIADLFVDWYRIPRPHVVLNIPELANESRIQPHRADALHQLGAAGGTHHAGTLRGEETLLQADQPSEPKQHSNIGSERTITLCYQGGLIRGRGLEQMISAMVLLPGDSHVKLVILGFGSLKPTLDDMIRKLALDERVIMAEPVPPDRVVPVTAAFDIGIIPFLPSNLNHILALPNKLFEYLAAGLCVWSAKGLVEVEKLLEEHSCGRTYQADDVERMTEQLAALVADADCIAQMKANALQAARHRFNWNEEKKVLWRIYQEN
jgi:glycosyltransferase involved in cell wall biosynthesis